jgi:hypothetical protein
MWRSGRVERPFALPQVLVLGSVWPAYPRRAVTVSGRDMSTAWRDNNNLDFQPFAGGVDFGGGRQAPDVIEAEAVEAFRQQQHDVREYRLMMAPTWLRFAAALRVMRVTRPVRETA